MADTEAKDIVAFKTHLGDVWKETHAHWENVVDPWVWGNPQIWRPGSKRSVYIPSTARNIIEHASDTQLVWEPKLHRRPIEKGREAEREADAIERGLYAVILDSMLREPTLAFKDAGKFMGMYGYAVIEGPMMDFEDRPEQPVKTKSMSKEEFEWAEIDYKNSLTQWNPIRIRAPHPKQILLDPTERQPREAIKFNKRSIRSIRKLVDGVRDRKRKAEFVITEAQMKNLFPSGISPFNTEDVIEYWTDTEHHLVVKNTTLFFEKNRWGFVPYNHAFSGFGMQKSSDAAGNPLYLAQGLLDPIMSGLKTQAQAMSAKQNALIERSYMRMRTSGDASEVSQQLAQEDALLELEEDELGFVRYPDLEKSLFQIGAEIDEDIEMGTFSRSVAGMRQQGVSTVGQQAILSTASSRKFANPNKQLNMMATVVSQNILRLVDRYGQVIEVAGEKLDPAVIKHSYIVQAEFQTLDPILQLQEREVGMREVTMGLKSHETYREGDLRIADESLEFKRLTKEQVRQRPEYIQALAREVAKEDGMLEMIEELQAAEAEGGGAPGETPQISDQAGGGATRALTAALTGDTANPPRTPLVPQGS
jgi:hypothetical protein